MADVVKKLTPAEKRWFASMIGADLDDLAEAGIRIAKDGIYIDDLDKANEHFEWIVAIQQRYGTPSDGIRPPPSIYSGAFLDKAETATKPGQIRAAAEHARRQAASDAGLRERLYGKTVPGEMMGDAWTRAEEETRRGSRWLDTATETYEEGMKSAGHYGDAGLRDAEDFRAKYFKLQDATRRGAPHGELADLYWEFDAEREKLDKHVRRLYERFVYANPVEEIRGVEYELDERISKANIEEHFIRGTPEAGPHLESGGSRPDLSGADRDALLEEISQERGRSEGLRTKVSDARSIIENPASSAHARRVAASDAKEMVDKAFRKVVTKVGKGAVHAIPIAGLIADFADIPEAQAGTIGSEFESAPEARARQQRDIESEQFLAEQPPSGMAQFAGPEGGERYAAERFGTPNDQEPIDMALQPTPEDITGGEVHIEEEDALLEKATQADDAMDEALLVAAPAGEFSAPALNALVEALNEVLPVMGLEDPYPTFEEDIEGTVPVEFVKYLTMVSAAATDAGLDRFAIKLEDIGNDTDLMKAAGQLDVLSKNDSFRSFMATTGREEAAAESDSTPVDFVPTPAPPTEDVESVLERRA